MADTRSAERPAAATLAGALGLDAALVVVFAAIGRASHAEGLSAWGIGMVALPFLVGLVVAWLVVLAWRAPLAPLRTGVPVALATVALGMVGRWMLGEGVQVAFVIVATLSLLVLLVGWRLLAALVRRARARTTAR